MGYLARLLAASAILLAGLAPLAAFDGPTQSTGPAKKAPANATPAPGEEQKADDKSADDKSKSAATAERTLEAGVKAYEGGKYRQAIRAFDAALQGTLNTQQVARALYYRGLSYRSEGKAALAISDLTAAIWLKDGLPPAEKQEAIKQRLAAYRDAGVSGVPDYAPPEPAPAAPPVASAPAASSPSSGWQAAMSEPTLAAQPAASAPPPSPPSSSGGGLSGFFDTITGGIFSSSSPSPSPAPADPVTTSSIPTPAASPQAEAEPSGWWSTATQVAPAEPPPSADPPPPALVPQGVQQKSTAVAHVAVAPPVPQPATRPKPRASGKYRLQVGTVRSREEADLLVARLLTEHGGELGGRDPEVDEAVIGSMGTFYRVRVGPYADAGEPQELCGALRSTGYDCLVVTQ